MILSTIRVHESLEEEDFAVGDRDEVFEFACTITIMWWNNDMHTSICYHNLSRMPSPSRSPSPPSSA